MSQEVRYPWRPLAQTSNLSERIIKTSSSESMMTVSQIANIGISSAGILCGPDAVSRVVLIPADRNPRKDRVARRRYPCDHRRVRSSSIASGDFASPRQIESGNDTATGSKNSGEVRSYIETAPLPKVPIASKPLRLQVSPSSMNATFTLNWLIRHPLAVLRNRKSIFPIRLGVFGILRGKTSSAFPNML